MITGKLWKEMLESGANNLTNQQHVIDALNVFPVPDGDTGTNMSLTYNAGVKEALACTETDVDAIAKVLSKGLLMGARGNSGVITSQIFRGFFQGVEGMDTLNGLQLANAFVQGSRVAYKAVMRPVEGTILTVIREAADYTFVYATSIDDVSCIDVMRKMVEEANASLERTPDLLPVLKEVGVVDSGGAGLVAILEGFLSAMEGTIIARDTSASAGAQSAGASMDHDEFGYCTEFIFRLENLSQQTFSEEEMREDLARLGDSIVCVQDDDIVKVHVHTLEPGEALKLAKRHGEFVKIKVENMQEQHEHLMDEDFGAATSSTPVIEKKKERSKYAIITVAAGAGIHDMFTELRADYIISGGQTMNPSTEDFVAGIDKVNADTIFILPNNSNIILAAEQAASVSEDSNVIVIPTKSIPQGLSACIMFNPEVDEESNKEEMLAAVEHVKTGQVTYAIKDTTYEGLEIHAQEYMSIYEKDIIFATPERIAATQTLLEKMIGDEDEIVTLIYGEDVSEEEAQEIEKMITDNYEVEVELVNGQQPVYSYIIGIE